MVEKRVFKKIKKITKKTEKLTKSVRKLSPCGLDLGGESERRKTRRGLSLRAAASTPKLGETGSAAAKQGAGATSVVRPPVGGKNTSEGVCASLRDRRKQERARTSERSSQGVLRRA